MVDFRYCDLMPDVPMDDAANAMEVYADAIGILELLGDNVRATYVTWGTAPGSGVLRRIAVLKITRPRASFLRAQGGISALLNETPMIRIGDQQMH